MGSLGGITYKSKETVQSSIQIIDSEGNHYSPLANKKIDVKKEGKFSMLMDKTEYKWRLPLSSLLPPRLCPIDDEKLNGAWKFCPTHGVELN